MADATTSQNTKPKKSKSKRRLEKDRARSKPYFENRRARAAEATPEQPSVDDSNNQDTEPPPAKRSRLEEPSSVRPSPVRSRAPTPELLNDDDGGSVLVTGEHSGTDMPLPVTTGLETAAIVSPGIHTPTPVVERSELVSDTEHISRDDASVRPTISGASPTLSYAEKLAKFTHAERIALQVAGIDPDTACNTMFPPCSPQDHTVRWLLEKRGEFQLKSNAVQAVALGPRGPDGRCLPKNELKASSKQTRYKCTVPGCPNGGLCDVSGPFWERLIGSLNLPEEDLWKLVVDNAASSKTTRPFRVFEVSARCNDYGGQKHCLRQDHLRIETTTQNAARRGHHEARWQCLCPDSCLGYHVYVDTKPPQQLEKERDAPRL
ncbi:hypothetical protein LTR27_003009 [Elasticomyces elasticus]|nr:hypothetical protein LTR27_003009 [Elasticomyces elasticus]